MILDRVSIHPEGAIPCKAIKNLKVPSADQSTGDRIVHFEMNLLEVFGFKPPLDASFQTDPLACQLCRVETTEPDDILNGIEHFICYVGKATSQNKLNNAIL